MRPGLVYDMFSGPGYWKNVEAIWNGFGSLLGITQGHNQQESIATQMDYEQYLRNANERALADWHRNVPNRTIKYPEFSYEGQIRRADTALTRLGLDYDTTYANMTSGAFYKGAGLYGVGSRLTRRM